MFGPTLLWGSLPCAYWPIPASPVLTGPSSSAARPGQIASPVLVVGDLNDPATPYAWAVSLARWLRPGVLLGWKGEGHTSYMEGSTCVDAAVDAYLINLTVPRNGTICP
jgi:pimeloyl-ACP methyl ester carboxylesterase